MDELLSGEGRGQKTKGAKDFLNEILADGQKSFTEIGWLAFLMGVACQKCFCVTFDESNKAYGGLNAAPLYAGRREKQ